MHLDRRKLTLEECPPQSEDSRVGCVFKGGVLAGRGRDSVQNNGTTVECGAVGNILKLAVGMRRSTLRKKISVNWRYNKQDDTGHIVRF